MTRISRGEYVLAEKKIREETDEKYNLEEYRYGVFNWDLCCSLGNLRVGAIGSEQSSKADGRRLEPSGHPR